ncbi:hypothetical protein [Halomicronema sp. CCY15110]|uniref:hypothetical protein n=1 Tax=Halomicronema sp. CCY15110 TaxID=2767773 RepID=UPI00195203D4|nr:hypothetical protein [Halomicronema sp. CCY15110]
MYYSAVFSDRTGQFRGAGRRAGMARDTCRDERPDPGENNRGAIDLLPYAD